MQESAQSTAATCRECGALLEAAPGFVVWCDRCGWNVQPLRPPQPVGLMGALYAGLGVRLGRQLYEEVRRATSLRRTLTPSFVAALLIATLIHMVTLVSLALGLAIVVQNLHQPFLIFIGIVLIVLALGVRPRLVPFPKSYLSKERFKALYGLSNAVATAMKAPPVDAIVIGTAFNAGYRRAGLRRRQILSLGLPLLTVLDEQETVALIAHELAHGINGAAARGPFIGTAVDSLVRWHGMLYPAPTRYAGRGIGSMSILISKPILLILAQIPLLAAMALSHLLWRDSQRAEYLADHLAARAAGTAALLSLLDKLQLEATFATVVQRTVVGSESERLFDMLRQRVDALPARERERLRRVARLEDSRLDATHPPTGLRIALLESRPMQQPLMHVDALRWRALRDELSAVEIALERQLIDAYRGRLYR